MATITGKDYRHLIQRQVKVEREVAVLKELFRQEADEKRIRPAVLKRWERISRDLDRGKGRVFHSVNAMSRWLNNL